MFFHSIEFILFFGFTLVALFTIPSKVRWMLLLTASFFFYYYLDLGFLLLLIFSSVIDYFLAGFMSRVSTVYKKHLLLTGLLNNILILVFFKYLNFFSISLNKIFSGLNIGIQVPLLKIAIPIGISYYTFKKISYLVDVFRNDLQPELHLGRFLLYTSFFPSLLAGPIDRAGKLLPQLRQSPSFDFDRIIRGGTQMLWGFFKKLVIADNLVPLVNTVFKEPRQFEGIHFIVAAFSFTIQIYCDFSGYSDIAVGAGRVLGFDLTDNFNRPYQARSISDFWSRWHISLSTWLRHYLFLPISFSISRRIVSPRLLRVKAEHWAYLTGMISTMLLCGLWHGADWHFVIWGGIHGLYIALAFVTRKKRAKFRKFLKIKKSSAIHRRFSIAVTFLFVSLAWIFFRADSISDAFYIISHLFTGIPGFFSDTAAFFSGLTTERMAGFLIDKSLGIMNLQLLLILPAIAFMGIAEALQKNEVTINGAVRGRGVWLRWSFYYVVIFGLLILGKFSQNAFIYFQF